MRGDFTPFISQSFQMWDHFFPLLFPKDVESLKVVDIRLQEVGAKRRWNGTSKVNRQTNTQTYGQIDKKRRRKNTTLNYLRFEQAQPDILAQKTLMKAKIKLPLQSWKPTFPFTKPYFRQFILKKELELKYLLIC